MRTAVRIVMLLLVCSLCQAVSAAEQRYLLAGSDGALWLVRQKPSDPPVFDAVVKPIGRPWRWAASDLTGAISNVAVVGQNLNALLGGGDLLILPPLSGASPLMGPKPPGSPRATCSAPPGLFGAEMPTLLIVAPSPATPASASSQGTDRPLAGSSYALWQCLGDSWQLVAALPRQLRDPDGVLLAANSQSVFALFSDASRSRPNRLFHWTGSSWIEVPLSGRAASDRILAILAGADELTLIGTRPPRQAGTSRPTQLELWIALLELSKMQLAYQQVQTTEGPITWPLEAPPLVARLGDRIALVWSQADTMYFATCGRDGELLTPSPVELLNKPPMDGQGGQINEYFVWAVMVLMFVSVVVWRPKTPPHPFVMPPGCKSGSVLRRAIAFVLDFLPFAMLGTYAFLPKQLLSEPHDWDELMRLSEQFSRSRAGGWAVVLTFTAYVAYAIIMEYRYGATIGKLILGLRVIEEEGRKLSLRAAVLRNLVKVVELYPWLLPLVAVMVMLSRSRQRFGDIIARTAVIDAHITRTAPPPPPDAQSTREDQTTPDPPGSTQ